MSSPTVKTTDHTGRFRRAACTYGVVHVVLLGDSIFDNASYTRGEPDVVTHLRGVLPAGVRATLCAVDGATTAGLANQVKRVPRDATHLIVAIGGNDALGNADLLDRPVSSTAEALSLFADRVDAFDASYRAALAPVLARNRPTIVCTIYNGNLEPPRARLARVALTLFNDVIVRFGFEHHVPVIDLRLICCDATDYANPIEPSGRGGLKIARAIAEKVRPSL
jgi:lysophospholipase L1-like esterase